MTPDSGLDIDAVRPTAELHCRPTTAAVVPLDRLYSRLDRLSSADVVDDVSVSTWPGRVAVTAFDDSLPDDDAESAVETFREFDAWAEAAGVSLGPAFGRHRYVSQFTEEVGVVFTFPVVALAVRDAETGDLHGVYPHHDDGPVSVDRGLERLVDRLDVPTEDRATRLTPPGK